MFLSYIYHQYMINHFQWSGGELIQLSFSQIILLAMPLSPPMPITIESLQPLSAGTATCENISRTVPVPREDNI